MVKLEYDSILRDSARDEYENPYHRRFMKMGAQYTSLETITGLPGDL